MQSVLMWFESYAVDLEEQVHKMKYFLFHKEHHTVGITFQNKLFVL